MHQVDVNGNKNEIERQDGRRKAPRPSSHALIIICAVARLRQKCVEMRAERMQARQRDGTGHGASLRSLAQKSEVEVDNIVADPLAVAQAPYMSATQRDAERFPEACIVAQCLQVGDDRVLVLYETRRGQQRGRLRTVVSGAHIYGEIHWRRASGTDSERCTNADRTDQIQKKKMEEIKLLGK